MPPRMMSLLGATYGMELIYSFIIIAICLIIYFETRQIYRLSSHKGVKYFRYTFLFFAISYLLKFFSRLLLIEDGINTRSLFLFILLLLTMYTYLMAGIYLVLSISWKKEKIGLLNKTLIWNLLAIAVVVLTIFAKLPLLYILFQAVILFYAIFLLYFGYKKLKDKKETPLIYIVYPFLLVFWILNILDIFLTNFSIIIQALIYIVSVGLFLSIIYKVIKKTNIKR